MTRKIYAPLTVSMSIEIRMKLEELRLWRGEATPAKVVQDLIVKEYEAMLREKQSAAG